MLLHSTQQAGGWPLRSRRGSPGTLNMGASSNFRGVADDFPMDSSNLLLSLGLFLGFIGIIIGMIMLGFIGIITTV